MASASLIVLVIRSRKPFYQSRPPKYLLMATLATVAVTVILPFTPLAGILGFGRPSATLLVLVAGIVALYMLAAEVVKRGFYKRVKF